MTRRLSARLFVLLSASLLIVSVSCSSLRSKPPLKWHLTLEPDVAPPLPQNFLRDAVQTIKVRLDRLEVPNYSVEARGSQIVVDLPGLRDPDRVKKVISTEGRLELVHVISPPNPSPAQTFIDREEAIESLGGTIPGNRRLLSYSDPYETVAGRTTWVVVDAIPIVAGTELRNATAVASSTPGNYSVAFNLKADAAKKFSEWSASNLNQYLGFVLNGDVKRIAFIRSQISDSAEISGNFSKESAEDLAEVLNSGPLPGPLKFVKEEVDSDH